MKRILESPLSSRAADLLRSAASDVPPRAAAEKARLVSAVKAEVATPETTRRFSSGKWLGLLAVLVATAGIVGSGYSLAPAQRTADAPVTTNPPPPANALVDQTANAAPAEAPPATVNVADLPTAVAAPIRPASAKTQTPSSVEPVTTDPPPPPRLEDELKAVDEARAAFVDHHPALALERVASYRRQFPAGHFTAEIEALEIQSLVALDRTDEARAKATRFLAEHPQSPYAQRVRSAVGSRSEPPRL
ncbi:MAG: hypothetical protein K0S65_2002 [Labilithrix sp.]|nr:hypothetical protein [Labilithrix sp.]